METMIDELKALLRNEENLDERELHYEFEQDTVSRSVSELR